ncbi:MAG: virulence RhuM family protein [Sulfurimonas sp.]|nr:virulence RhuM family protein [Sulfurimonas sp.]
MNNLIKYNDGEIELTISLDKETIWLSQLQISELFDTSSDNVSLHLKNIYNEKELDEKRTTEDFSVVRQEGKRKVKRTIKHYNLDSVISIGYRVSSYKATKFRQWATSVLKEYISDGYAINTHKITEQRLTNLEKDMQFVKSNIKNSSLDVKQEIFYDGQIFDAYLFVSDIIKSAKTSIKLIDNFIDESTLVLFTKRDANIKTIIYTKTISKELQLDLKKYNAQYQTIEIKKFDLSHDRFLIVDEKEVYHFGASLKDLGKKWFAVSKMDIEVLNIMERLK